MCVAPGGFGGMWGALSVGSLTELGSNSALNRTTQLEFPAVRTNRYLTLQLNTGPPRESFPLWERIPS